MVLPRMRRAVAVGATAALAAAILPVIPSQASGLGPAAAGPMPGAASQAQSTARVDYGPVVAALSREIPDVMGDSGAVGLTIALVDRDRVVWTHGFGLADRRSGRPVTADTLFHIGSASKTVSAIAVMQLVERGLVDLDAPLSRYVPEFRLLPRFDGNVITVRTVLDHHSGIPGDVFNGLITTGSRDPGFRRWLLDALRGMYPERRVNTLYAYNNSGYVLLQSLVENVTGMPFERYSRTRLFAPMAMPHSTYDDASVDVREMTANYQATYADDGSVTGAERRPREYVNGWTAGSIMSSADDMANYLRTLLGGGHGPAGRVLTARSLAAMWRPQVRPPLDIAPFRFGLGFGLGLPGLDWAGRVVWHDGATVWNHTMLALLPDAGLGVFVSVNTATAAGPSARVAERALELAYTARTGTPPPPDRPLPASPEASASSDVLAAVAGYYAGTSGLDLVAATTGGLDRTVQVGTPAAVTTAMRPHRDGWFRPVDLTIPFQLTFRRVAGRQLSLARIPWGHGPATVIVGQRLPAYDVPRAWRSALGTYRAVDADPRVDPSLVARTITLRREGGRLVADLSNEAGTQALRPGPRGSMLTFGIGPGMGRGKGECLVPARTRDGRAAFTYLGVRYVRTSS